MAECREIVQTASEHVRKAKALMELSLARTSKATRKASIGMSVIKMKAREKIGPLQEEAGDLVTQDIEKAEVLNDFLTSVFSGKYSSHTAQVAEGKSRNWQSEEPPALGEDQVKEHLRNLKVHKSMGPNEMHPWVLKELVDEVTKPLSITFEKLRQCSEVPTDWKKGNINPIFKKRKKGRPGDLQVSQSHLCAQQDHGADPP